MRPRIKRLVVKATALSVIANAVLLYAKYRQQGHLNSRNYQMAAASFATTLLLIGVIAFLFLRFGNLSGDDKKA